MSEQPGALVRAWQQALAGEHAAVYAYEVAGGRLKAGTRPQVRTAAAYRHHRSRRDALTARLRAAGATPVRAEPAYELPVDVTNAARAAKLAVHVERRCTALYAQVVAAGSDGDRQMALEAMTWCATHELAWGGTSTAMPGLRL